MTRQPLRIDRPLVAALRPGVQVFAHLGAAVQLPRRRARGYERRLRADIGGASVPMGVTALPPRSTIAVVEVRGMLEQRASIWSCGESAGYDEITARLLGANADPSVAGAVLAGDTPGGDGPGLAECVRRIRAAFDASRKPLLCFADELLASAGFWLASACDGVYGPEMSRVGSIGCIVVHQTEARALEEMGVDTYVARDPGGKAKPNPVELLDDVGRARLDAMAARGAAAFRAYVSARRPKLTDAALRAMDGELYDAADALPRGLLDGIGSLETVIDIAASLAAPQGTP